MLTADDLLEKRDIIGRCPRDNVLFELGLFMGALGRNRTFIVHSRTKPPLLPTDLAGITPATFEERSNLAAALGPACTRSEEQADADDLVRNEVEHTGGIWTQMSPEQRAQIRARLLDKKRRAQAARAQKQAEQKTPWRTAMRISVTASTTLDRSDARALLVAGRSMLERVERASCEATAV